jgi:predicted nucleic acid-binding protein
VRVHLVDTGPLVAYLDRSDHHHAWAVKTLQRLPAPLRSAESVLTEAGYLLRTVAGAGDRLLDLVEIGAVAIEGLLPAEVQTLRRFLRKYAVADYADACLVRLSEIHEDSTVITIDTDFRHYRRHRNRAIPLVAPWQ